MPSFFFFCFYLRASIPLLLEGFKTKGFANWVTEPRREEIDDLA